MSQVEKITSYLNLEFVGIYPIQHIEHLHIERNLNDHAFLRIRGIFPEEEQARLIQMEGASEPVEVIQKDEHGKRLRTLFHGIITHVNLSTVRDIYYIEIEAVSHTIQLDVKPITRSFQDRNLTYEKLQRQILSKYEGSDIIDTVSQNAKLGEFTLQYRETDWAFLKRMASRFGGVLVPEIAAETPKFWFGMPEGNIGELDEVTYSTKRSFAAIRGEGNAIEASASNHKTCYIVESGQYFRPGDFLRFRGKELVVTRIVSKIHSGLLLHEYTLVQSERIRQNICYNAQICGASLEGKVIDVMADQVRVHLSIDEQQDKSKASWFPYDTGFSAEGDTGWYVMPELGDTVQLQFSNERESEGFVKSSIRRSKSFTPQLTDPDVKYWGTSRGKELKLSPSEVLVTAKMNKVYIQLDQNGVQVQSEGELSIYAGRTLTLDAGTKLSMQAGDSIYMQASRSSLILDGEADLRSSLVKLDGIIKRPVYVADLAPVPEPPLMTVQAYNEVKASQSKPASGKTIAKMNPKSGILDGILNKVQTCLSVAGMIPMVGSVATVLNTGVNVYKKNYKKAGLSLLASVPKNVARPNPLNAHYLLTNSLLARGAAGDKKALDEWIKRVNALPKPKEKISEYEKRQRELTATYPSNPTLKWMKKNILVPGVDGINYFLLETTAGKTIERFSTSSAAAIGSPVDYEVASTGNETVDKIGDFAGNIAGNFLTPTGSGIKGQGFYSGTVKIAESTLTTKAGQAVENKLANGIGKVMSPEASQKISNGILTGSISGGLQSVGLSLTHDRSKGDELAEALVTGATLGGALGGAFAGLGPIVKSNMGKVYTSARQLTSSGKTAQLLSLLKQKMKIQASPKINPAKTISKEMNVTTKPVRVNPRLSTGGVGKYKVTSPKINQSGPISKGKINIAAKPSSSSIKLTDPKMSKPKEMPLETKGTDKAGSSGSKGVLNVKQVEYGSDDLSKAAQQFRIDNNITGGQNVLIAEVEVNGVVKRYQIVSSREEIVVGEETVEKITHSEKIFDDIMKKEGISPDQVKRLYSEREPCILDGHNCKQLLSKEYPNAEVTYSFEYGDQKSRNRGNKKLKQALKQLFGIN
ncbi:nucleic acid/nucleotide deaminase domain-containing protein [Paenibacillus ottowii]